MPGTVEDMGVAQKTGDKGTICVLMSNVETPHPTAPLLTPQVGS